MPVKVGALTAEEAKRLIAGLHPGRKCRVEMVGQRSNADQLFAQGGSPGDVADVLKDQYGVTVGEHALRAHGYKKCPCFANNKEASRAK